MNRFIEIDHKKMNVGITGSGKHTVVLLSGSGIPIPTLHYRSMSEALALDHKIIVIEKFGYGYSDLTDENRAVDTVIEEYREALRILKVHTPVILMAHSMAFIEALRWSQLYPAEVSGLIGLDPATPECYRDFNIEAALQGLLHMANNKQCREDAGKAVLTQLEEEFNFPGDEMNAIRTVVNRNLANQGWISEAENLRNSIAIVADKDPAQIPTLFLVSNGEGTTLDTAVWRSHAINYIKKIKVSECYFFDYPHNLNKFVPEEIACSVHKFVAKHIL